MNAIDQCPVCESGSVGPQLTEPFAAIGDTLHYDLTCEDCGSTWTVIAQPIGVDITSNAEELTHPLVIKIAQDGDVMTIYHPDKQADAADALTADLGVVTEDARGGYVWPKNTLKRFVFKALRQLFGGKGKIADWTRAWTGPWQVISARTGHTLPGTYTTHADAVQAEVRWLTSEA